MEAFIIDYTFLTIQRGLSATKAKTSGPHFLHVGKKIKKMLFFPKHVKLSVLNF